MSYQHGVDANQGEIVAALRGCGVWVLDLSALPHADPRAIGVADLLCVDIGGAWFAEVKTAEGRLRDEQRLFAAECPLPTYELRSQDDAIDVATERRNRAIERRNRAIERRLF